MRTIFYLAFIFLWIVQPVFAAEKAPEKHQLDFTGKAKAGDVFRFSAKTSRSSTYTMRIPGADEPAVRTENVFVSAHGTLTFHEVNKAGNPLKLSFVPTSFEGSINGKDFAFRELADRTIIADLSGAIPVFTLEQKEVADDPNAALLGAKKSNTKPVSTLPPEAVFMLETLFHQAGEESLSDTLGKGISVAFNEPFPINTNQLRAALAKRNLNLKETDIEAEAILELREKFWDVDSWKINLRIQSNNNIPGYDFRFNATIMLPVDTKLGGAVRIQRSVKEVVDKRLPTDNFFAAGNTLELDTTDHTDILLLPIRSKK